MDCMNPGCNHEAELEIGGQNEPVYLCYDCHHILSVVSSQATFQALDDILPKGNLNSFGPIRRLCLACGHPIKDDGGYDSGVVGHVHSEDSIGLDCPLCDCKEPKFKRWGPT